MLDALHRLAHHADGARVVETLRKHAPTWLVQMPGAIDDAAFNDLQKKVEGASQQRMLREMADALEQLCVQRPVVLAFEDLHWSDPSTITLIDLLARRTERARLLIVGTHRPLAILPAEHPLRILVHELAGRYCEELSLPPLTPNEVAEYLGNRIEPRDATERHRSIRWRVRSISGPKAIRCTWSPWSARMLGNNQAHACDRVRETAHRYKT